MRNGDSVIMSDLGFCPGHHIIESIVILNDTDISRGIPRNFCRKVYAYRSHLFCIRGSCSGIYNGYYSIERTFGTNSHFMCPKLHV